MMTTYDFGRKTFGHATMNIGPILYSLPGGRRISVGEINEKALAELHEAHEKLQMEQAKEKNGEPFDAEFIYGVDPTGWIIGGKRLVKVGDRLWSAGR